jgi:hypothetical protein
MQRHQQPFQVDHGRSRLVNGRPEKSVRRVRGTSKLAPARVIPRTGGLHLIESSRDETNRYGSGGPKVQRNVLRSKVLERVLSSRRIVVCEDQE